MASQNDSCNSRLLIVMRGQNDFVTFRVVHTGVETEVELVLS
jgi:hypothetical protein